MEALLLEAGVQIYSRAGALVRPVIDEVPAAKGRMTTVAQMSPLIAVSLADMVARIMRVQRFARPACMSPSLMERIRPSIMSLGAMQ